MFLDFISVQDEQHYKEFPSWIWIFCRQENNALRQHSPWQVRALAFSADFFINDISRDHKPRILKHYSIAKCRAPAYSRGLTAVRVVIQTSMSSRDQSPLSICRACLEWLPACHRSA